MALHHQQKPFAPSIHSTTAEGEAEGASTTTVEKTQPLCNESRSGRPDFTGNNQINRHLSTTVVQGLEITRSLRKVCLQAPLYWCSSYSQKDTSDIYPRAQGDYYRASYRNQTLWCIYSSQNSNSKVIDKFIEQVYKVFHYKNLGESIRELSTTK